MFTKIVHMMGSKVLKIQTLIHTTYAFWQTDISHFVPFLFFLPLQTFPVCTLQDRSVKSIYDTGVTVAWFLCFSRDSAIMRVIVSTGALQTWMWAPNCGGSAGIHCVPSFILAQANMQTEKFTHNLTRDQTPNPPTYSLPSDMLFY